MYKVDIALPPCDKEDCYCVSCIEKCNQENCNLLIRLASEARDSLITGKYVDLCKLGVTWNKESIPFRRSTQEDHKKEKLDILCNRGIPRNLSFKTSLKKGFTSIWENKDGFEVVQKCSTDGNEALVHQQLHEHLVNKPLLIQLIPRFLGIRDNTDAFFMEKIEGITLHDALPTIGDMGYYNGLITTLAVIHGFFAYLKDELGFLHGDVSPANIMLRGWDVNDMKKRYDVPLIVSKDDIRIVQLPFIPVIIDFGISSTRKWCDPWDYVNPYRSELMDVKDLYLHIQEYNAMEGGIIDRVQMRLERIFSKGWREGPRLAIPIPLVVEDLTHKSLLQAYLRELEKHP